MAPVVRMESITKRFGALVANDRIDFSLEAGETHALVGENGAGKTTLMRILYGQYAPDAGKILINGEPCSYHVSGALKHGIGMVHQNFMQIDHMSITENIILGHAPTRADFIDYRAAKEKIRGLLARFGMQKISPTRRSGTSAWGAPEDRDHQGALSGRAGAHPRRADGGADAAGVGRALQRHRRAQKGRHLHRLHLPQAAGGHPGGGPYHRHAQGAGRGAFQARGGLRDRRGARDDRQAGRPADPEQRAGRGGRAGLRLQETSGISTEAASRASGTSPLRCAAGKPRRGRRGRERADGTHQPADRDVPPLGRQHPAGRRGRHPPADPPAAGQGGRLYLGGPDDDGAGAAGERGRESHLRGRGTARPSAGAGFCAAGRSRKTRRRWSASSTSAASRRTSPSGPSRAAICRRSYWRGRSAGTPSC